MQHTSKNNVLNLFEKIETIKVFIIKLKVIIKYAHKQVLSNQNWKLKIKEKNENK